ncbi:MAG: sensor histidine kinase, partial [Mariniphaga sp.]|nr:sensor histidine kinase [Mariniphaga sp.]
FNDKIIYAEVCNHLGGLYLLIDQPEKSLEFHHKALNNRNVINNPEGIAKSYNNIGKIFLDRKQSDSALVYFSQSLELCQKTGYNKGTVKALTNLGKVYLIQNKPEKQKEVLQRAFNISKESGYTIGMAESGMELGNYYRKLQKSDLAIRQYQLSLKMTGESNQSEILQADYYGLYQCYLKKGAVQEALENHILLSDIEKKLLNVENNRQIAILQISYETHRKEKYNQVLLKDLELGEMTIKRKTDLILLIIIALGSCFLLCVLLYLRIVNRQKANRILGKLNLKIVKQNTELEILNAELEKANQEKDIVFSIITHELRNPLYWFQNLVEMLSKKYQTMKPDKVQKTLLALDESAKNAYHLMDNLLNWSRTKLKRITPNKEKHSLLSLVNETIRMYETILEHKEILLQVNIFGEAMIYVDRDLFTCVLRNLISNAIKYTPSNGIIEIGCVENELKFLINVSDSGKGIDERNMEKIFDVNEYFSSPGLLQEKGSGLGLKICIEFVELNNGKIWATSEPGKGTTFNFTVPKVTMGIEPGFE